jgi:hypothetical protein
MDEYVTGPIGRKTASDEVLRQGVADMVGGLPMPEGGVHPMQVEVLKRLAKSDDLTAEGIHGLAAADVASKEVKSIPEWIANQALTNAVERTASREVLEKTAAELAGLHGGRMGLTEAGSTVRQFGLGSPVAAYSAVAGGGILALKGAYDVITRMHAGEPVSEEEVAMADKVIKESAVAGVQ